MGITSSGWASILMFNSIPTLISNINKYVRSASQFRKKSLYQSCWPELSMFSSNGSTFLNSMELDASKLVRVKA